jgi:hypothetical protein
VRRVAATAVSVLLAGLTAGCAGTTTSSAGRFTGESAAVAKVIDQLETAASNHDTARICNGILATNVAARLGAGNCKTVIGKQLDTVDTFTATVETVKITGKTAQAQVKSTSNGKDHRDTLKLVKGADRRWRIESLG